MKTLGRYDRVDLPELGLRNIHAKVDTGAFRCSLHCQSVQIIDGELEFVLLDEEHPEFTGHPFRAKHFHEREIKNSFGESEKRFVITTTLTIHGETFEADFSLSNRGSLKFPILLGRRILQKRFLIDVTQKNISYKEKIKQKKVKQKTKRA
jgi:hypothetical protein